MSRITIPSGPNDDDSASRSRPMTSSVSASTACASSDSASQGGATSDRPEPLVTRPVPFPPDAPFGAFTRSPLTHASGPWPWRVVEVRDPGTGHEVAEPLVGQALVAVALDHRPQHLRQVVLVDALRDRGGDPRAGQVAAQPQLIAVDSVAHQPDLRHVRAGAAVGAARDPGRRTGIRDAGVLERLLDRVHDPRQARSASVTASPQVGSAGQAIARRGMPAVVSAVPIPWRSKIPSTPPAGRRRR